MGADVVKPQGRLDGRVAASDDEDVSAEVLVRVVEPVADVGEVLTVDPKTVGLGTRSYVRISRSNCMTTLRR
jgi:hypothetical protein